MTPTINNGDLIIYKPFVYDKDILYKGSLVVVNHPLKESTLIVKRISKLSELTIELLGDNRRASIASRHFGQVSKTLVQGVVEKIIPKSK